jgi:putative adenylate-forming enzyme
MSFRLRVLWHYLLAGKQRSFPDRAALERWQDAQVTRHLQRIVPRSPWLQQRFGSLPLARWRELPIVGKREMMEHFDMLNTVGLSRDACFAVGLQAEQSRDFTPELQGITVGFSSGTSGGRGLFLASEAERAEWAGQALRRLLPGPLWQGHRIALFLRASSNLYAAVKSRWVRLSWYDLAERWESHQERLEQEAPTLLVAPPSVLRRIAESGWKISPQKIVSVAETLDALDRERLAAAFSLPIDELYQATEGFLGSTDGQGVLRLHEELLVVEPEWIDTARTRFVPIITDFRRTTQPMIRHRLDDVLQVHPQFGEAPPRALLQIEGRCDDLLQVDGQTIFPDFVARALLAADATLEDFRVTQVAERKLHVALRSTQPAAPTLSALQQRLAELTHPSVLVECVEVPWPESESLAQKRRRIRRQR